MHTQMVLVVPLPSPSFLGHFLLGAFYHPGNHSPALLHLFLLCVPMILLGTFVSPFFTTGSENSMLTAEFDLHATMIVLDKLPQMLKGLPPSCELLGCWWKHQLGVGWLGQPKDSRNVGTWPCGCWARRVWR